MKRILLLGLLSVLSSMMHAQIMDNGTEHDKWGFISAPGKWVVQPIYEHTYWNTEGLFGTARKGAENTNTTALVDKKGGIMTPFKYSNVYYDKKSGLIRVYRRIGNAEVEGYCNKQGKEIIPCEYTETHSSSCGMHVVIMVSKSVNGKELKGAYNAKGEMIIPCQFDEIMLVDAGIGVYIGDNCGAYGYDGKIIYDAIYATEIAFCLTWNYIDLNIGGKKGEKSSILGGKWGIGDKSGNILVPCKYEMVETAGDNIFRVNSGGKRNGWDIVGGKWGYYANGQEIIPCQYDKVSGFENGVATVSKDGKVILIKNPLENSDDIQIIQGDVSLAKKRDPNALVVSRYPAPNSDVDKNIPVVKASENSNLFAFIIANENYSDAPVPYALNDGRIFKEYCLKTLGLPEKHIRLFEDATFGNIITAVEQMKSIAEAYEGKAQFLIYYAGHGVPDEKKQTAYLLPVDGNGADITTTGYSLERFYNELSRMPLADVTVFLDACFSGAKREDEMLTSARGVAIKVQEEAPKGNMVVFSAAAGDETAHQYPEKGHGLFTYFLLKKLQESKGIVSLGDLSEYVTRQVKRHSVVINNKKQTPTVIPSAVMMEKWRKRLVASQSCEEEYR